MKPMTTLPATSEKPLARDGFIMAMIALLGLGTMMVFSSTGATRVLELRTDYLVKHLTFLSLAGVMFLTVINLPTRLILKLAPWMYLAGLGLLALVLIPGLGVKINGARRWFHLGPVSLQPSEFMKILLPLFLATMSRWSRQRTYTLANGIAFIAILITPVLIAIEPDLGTAAIVFCMGACYLFLAGFPLKLFVAGFSCMVPVLGGLMLYRPYQLKRVMDYVTALGNWENAQYQVKQSLLSIGSGGMWGIGPGRGLQKLSFLPESHTDFVFAVIGEELGLVGTLATISLWLLLFLCGIKLVQRVQQDRERFALAGTLLAGIVIQAAINVCVVTSLVPPKGISHPLLSYGGSNLLATMLAFALIINLTQQQKNTLSVDHLHSTQFD